MRDGWVETTLADHCEIKQGQTLAVSNMDGGGFPVFGANGVIGTHSEHNYNHPVVALGCRGSCGTVNVVTEAAWLANNVMALWPKSIEELDLAFLSLVLETSDLKSSGVISGQVQPQITRQSLSPLNFCLAPLAEQRRIVDVIESVDNYIAALEKRAEAARTARSALLHDLLSNPGPGWQMNPLAEIASVDRGVAWSKDEESWTESKASVPVVRIGNIQLSGIDMTERLYVRGVSSRDRERKAIRPSTILMVGSNGNPERVGNSHLAGDELNGHLYASFLIGITPTEEVAPEFLLATIQSRTFQRAITDATAGSTGLKNISLSWLREFTIAIPPISRQREVADLIGAFDSTLTAVMRGLSRAQKLRSALLTDLLSGNHEIPASYDELLGAA